MALDDGSGETAWAIKITDGGSNENFEMGRVISRTFSVYGRNFVTFTILSSSARVMKAVKIGCAEIGEHAAPASRTLSQPRFRRRARRVGSRYSGKKATEQRRQCSKTRGWGQSKFRFI
jgi:hypothetical protein